MRITFADAKTWRYVIRSISKFIETGVAKVTEDGFRFKALDPSKVILLDFIIPRESFEEFDLGGKESVDIPFNVEDLTKILRTASKDDKISLGIERNKLNVALITKGVERVFTLPLLTLEMEEVPELSGLELKNKFRMLGPTYYDVINSIEDLGDMIKLKGAEDKLIIMSISDLGEAEIDLDIESGTLTEVIVEEPGEASYGMEYFSNLKQVGRVAETVLIEFSTAMPCHMVFELAQGARMEVYVAPRTE